MYILGGLSNLKQHNISNNTTLCVSFSITDSAVEPLKAELAELDQLIEDQQDKIRAVKANILKNEDKIRRMVLSINLSSRRWRREEIKGLGTERLIFLPNKNWNSGEK